jgi:hypothetical protein
MLERLVRFGHVRDGRNRDHVTEAA